MLAAVGHSPTLTRPQYHTHTFTHSRTHANSRQSHTIIQSSHQESMDTPRRMITTLTRHPSSVHICLYCHWSRVSPSCGERHGGGTRCELRLAQGLYTLETSRSGAGPMSALGSLLLLGKQGLRALIGHAVSMTQLLRHNLSAHPFTAVVAKDSFGTVTMFRVFPGLCCARGDRSRY